MFKLGLGSAVVSDDQIKGLLRVSQICNVFIGTFTTLLIIRLVLKWKLSILKKPNSLKL